MLPRLSLLALTTGLIVSCSAQTPNAASDSSAVAHLGGRSNLLQFDFENGQSWPLATTRFSAVPKAKVVQGTATSEVCGTLDVAGSALASRGLRLAVDSSRAKGDWSATLTSGLLPVTNTETNLGKLTLAFNLSASAARPVRVRVESFDESKKRTGGLETTIYPAAPDFYQRFALDLSTLKAVGAGTFGATSPFVQFTFALDGSNWPAAKNELRLDNVHYAKPSWYVSASGNDKSDGRTEKTAFATPNKALDVAGPGDIIVVMDGTYTANSAQGGVAAFVRPGTPAGWITLKNYPGQHPTFSAVGTWNAIKIGSNNKENPYTGPALAYLEVRGLHVRGDADMAKEKYADLIGKPEPYTNSNGISVESRTSTYKSHHLRFADNVIEYCAGGGISVIHGDWMTIENNISRNNCWWMIYAGSGISFLGGNNFDGSDNTYRALIRNNVVSGNRCFQPWVSAKKISDGNGIIIDSTNEGEDAYKGRTLIQNNVSFNNGGSGIHSFRSRRVDIVNNTAYYNGASPELRWGQIFLQRTDDAHVINNILVSRDDQPVNMVSKDANDKQNTNVVRANNLYFGGNTPPIMGIGDVIADPQFVKADTDFTVANFRLQPNSPARTTGSLMPLVPIDDLTGKVRPLGEAIDKGAYQQ